MTAEDEEAVDLEYEEIIKQNLPDVPVTTDNFTMEVSEFPRVPTEDPGEKIKQKPQQLLA